MIQFSEEHPNRVWLISNKEGVAPSLLDTRILGGVVLVCARSSHQEPKLHKAEQASEVDSLEAR